jgi:hypothetical protein
MSTLKGKKAANGLCVPDVNVRIPRFLNGLRKEIINANGLSGRGRDLLIPVTIGE